VQVTALQESHQPEQREEQIKNRSERHLNYSLASFLRNFKDIVCKTSSKDQSETLKTEGVSYSWKTERQQVEIMINNRLINCMRRSIEFKERRMHIFLFIDFTQLQESEKQKLEIKFKNIFLSSMSHNLKTPLNSKKHYAIV
jgi:signal transduction histidine kinase